MARIQVLELPADVVGEAVRTPFAIVIDQLAADEIVDTQSVADKLGAVGVILHAGTLDVA